MTRKKEKTHSRFDNYLLQEYSNIAEAHFRTIETISVFFRNYLLLMTIPITLVASAIGLIKDKNTYFNFIEYLKVYGGYFLMIIAIIGIFVYLYIINLRLDAILYARTINGIRKYFYETISESFHLLNRFRVLPQSPYIPLYYEKHYFYPVLFAFGIFNGFYFSMGAHFTNMSISGPIFESLLKYLNNYVNNTVTIIIFIIVASIIIHIVLYKHYTKHREYGYLKSHVIGIDIDGVLNKHRTHFCNLYNKNKKSKLLKPKDIKTIPVHETKKIKVTREEEQKIFNNPRYWIDMPAENDIESNLNKLRNEFKFKLKIFTYRPWPALSKENETQNKNILHLWRKSLNDYELSLHKKNGNIQLYVKWYVLIKNIILNIFYFRDNKIINRITKVWLKTVRAKYDKLIIETGNEYVTDFRGKYRNRFIISRKEQIKYFVEDDLEKAIKLSFICDYVFLIAHPYNKPKNRIPENIIIVKSLNDVYRSIRNIS